MTRNLFEGKNVLVVGGNSGIGLAAAKAFSQEGANLIITGRNVETLTSKADEIGGRTSAYQCDVTDMEQIKDLVVKVELEFGYLLVPANTLLVQSIQSQKRTGTGSWIQI